MSLEHKFCALGTEVTVTDGTIISGYASLFGKPDQGGDTVVAGAYATSLTNQRSVKMLWQHDPAQPIGVWDEVREDAKGLWVKGRLLTDVAKGREAASLIGAGAIDGLSIGYRTVKSHKDDKGRRLLSELELWEVSLVTFPMLPDARVAAKGDAPQADLMRDLAAAFETARRVMARD
ncbi:HK97 family phage prohead protease [Yoonia sp. SS1-5]|uniref:HK97 family phage prohead protease n=1 Tax=Yoonia rhodophyticola TaxID=3137370 RepID=A0AAN0M791_9RHOB